MTGAVIKETPPRDGKIWDVLVIGCGIVGAAAAYELAKYNLTAAVLEKENDVAVGTSKANSAIIHAGYDPPPGTLMARLNVEGNRLTRELCGKLDVPFRGCGSLVLAFDEEELDRLEELYDRGLANGVPDMRLLNWEETAELEPELNGNVVGALLAPTAMIVSPWELTLALAETAVRNGAEVFLETRVTSIKRNDSCWEVTAGDKKFLGRFILNAAGVEADTVHNMAAEPEFTIFPNRGEYFLLDKNEGTRVSHIIFQCPDKKGKGTLVAPTVHGNLIVGPNSEPVESREDLACTAGGLAQVAERALRSVPGLDLRANIRNFAGIRAAADRKDFIIAQAKGAPGFFDLAGIKSPGLSAAPAIALMALDLLKSAGLQLEKKKDIVDSRKRLRFAELSADRRAALAESEPAYGRVVCRCETVTEGEILAALESPIPPRTVDAVKRRCNTGMGRCQGGFCSPRVLELLAGYWNVTPLEILQDGADSPILTGETKTGAFRKSREAVRHDV